VSALHHELGGEVPTDVWTIAFQKFVDWVGLFPIDVHLLHQSEVGTTILGKLLDFLWSARLLIAELVARECQRFERFRTQGLVQLSQLLVVFLGEASFGCDVGDEGHFILQGSKIEVVTIKVFGFEGEEVRCFNFPCLSSLGVELCSYRSHCWAAEVMCENGNFENVKTTTYA